jgi:hypothetical protein
MCHPAVTSVYTKINQLLSNMVLSKDFARRFLYTRRTQDWEEARSGNFASIAPADARSGRSFWVIISSLIIYQKLRIPTPHRSDVITGATSFLSFNSRIRYMVVI